MFKQFIVYFEDCLVWFAVSFFEIMIATVSSLLAGVGPRGKGNPRRVGGVAIGCAVGNFGRVLSGINVLHVSLDDLCMRKLWDLCNCLFPRVHDGPEWLLERGSFHVNLKGGRRGLVDQTPLRGNVLPNRGMLNCLLACKNCGTHA